MWHADFPLVLATACSEQVGVQMLLQSGADLFVIDGQGRSCFWAAAALGASGQTVGSMLLLAVEVCSTPWHARLLL